MINGKKTKDEPEEIMTRDEVLSLNPHDQVYWNDPDDGSCSRFYYIVTIDHSGPHDDDDDPIVKILDEDGSCLECYASELSWGPDDD